MTRPEYCSVDLRGRAHQRVGLGARERGAALPRVVLQPLDGPVGNPHVRPLGVISIGNTWYFSSGPGTRKSRNIARDPRCVVSVATDPFDLVVEGRAERVVDAAELERVAAAFAAQGWPASVAGEALTAAYSAPSAGPPPWNVYRVVPSRVFALGTAEPYGATRFDLTPSTACG